MIKKNISKDKKDQLNVMNQTRERTPIGRSTVIETKRNKRNNRQSMKLSLKKEVEIL